MSLSKHQYYYKSTGKKSGIQKSDYTHNVKGCKITNQEVVKMIKETLTNPDTQYGYIKMTYHLKTQGYIINKKKVYRLMKEHNLLGQRYKHNNKTYAKYRKVLPEKPLQVIEMDIKFVWIEQARKHAYILTAIDTFTRMTLHHIVLFSITKREVKQFWEHIIINHLQPNNCLNQEIDIEVRNDNDKRFSAKMIQDFFKENYLNQVFTHPYTPQENGHIESFHAILSKHLKQFNFWSFKELEQNLVLFYESYNNVRLHGSIAYTSPRTFWDLWNLKLIDMKIDKDKRKTTFKLKINHCEIHQHTGNNEPEGSFLHDFAEIVSKDKKMIGAETSYQHTV